MENPNWRQALGGPGELVRDPVLDPGCDCDTPTLGLVLPRPSSRPVDGDAFVGIELGLTALDPPTVSVK